MMRAQNHRPWSRSPSRLLHEEIRRKIGEGGMGEVYEALGLFLVEPGGGIRLLKEGRVRPAGWSSDGRQPRGIDAEDGAVHEIDVESGSCELRACFGKLGRDGMAVVPADGASIVLGTVNVQSDDWLLHGLGGSDASIPRGSA